MSQSHYAIFNLIKILWWLTFLKETANDRAIEKETDIIINHRHSMESVDDRSKLDAKLKC